MKKIKGGINTISLKLQFKIPVFWPSCNHYITWFKKNREIRIFPIKIIRKRKQKRQVFNNGSMLNIADPDFSRKIKIWVQTSSRKKKYQQKIIFFLKSQKFVL